MAAYSRLDAFGSAQLGAVFECLPALTPHSSWVDEIIQICAAEDAMRSSTAAAAAAAATAAAAAGEALNAEESSEEELVEQEGRQAAPQQQQQQEEGVVEAAVRSGAVLAAAEDEGQRLQQEPDGAAVGTGSGTIAIPTELASSVGGLAGAGVGVGKGNGVGEIDGLELTGVFGPVSGVAAVPSQPLAEVQLASVPAAAAAVTTGASALAASVSSNGGSRTDLRGAAGLGSVADEEEELEDEEELLAIATARYNLRVRNGDGSGRAGERGPGDDTGSGGGSGGGGSGGSGVQLGGTGPSDVVLQQRPRRPAAAPVLVAAATAGSVDAADVWGASGSESSRQVSDLASSPAAAEEWALLEAEAAAVFQAANQQQQQPVPAVVLSPRPRPPPSAPAAAASATDAPTAATGVPPPAVPSAAGTRWTNPAYAPAAPVLPYGTSPSASAATNNILPAGSASSARSPQVQGPTEVLQPAAPAAAVVSTAPPSAATNSVAAAPAMQFLDSVSLVRLMGAGVPDDPPRPDFSSCKMRAAKQRRGTGGPFQVLGRVWSMDHPAAGPEPIPAPSG